MCFLLVFLALVSVDSFQIRANLEDVTPLTVPNAFQTLLFWDPSALLSNKFSPQSKSSYPFLTTIELMTATGGCYVGFPGCSSTRDHFNVPSNPNSGYNFSTLLKSIETIVEGKFRPHIVLANIPIALSQNPVLGGFGVNKSPPTSMKQYFDYIAALIKQSVEKFGLQQVQTWRFGVFTEYNNQDWLTGPATNFFEIYDWTACAISSVLGERIDIGAHACSQCGGSKDWDPFTLLDHVKTGTNYCTGRKGSPMTYITNSFYEVTPGNPGDLSEFQKIVGALKNHVDSLKMKIEVGIDEGRILMGPEQLALTTRAVGQTYQASFDAYFFKLMAYGGISYYARWGVNSGGGPGVFKPWENADNVAVNVANLVYRMNGEKLLTVSNVTKVQGGEESIVDSVISFIPGKEFPESLKILLFNHIPDMNSKLKAEVDVQVCGFSKSLDLKVSGSETRVDDDHGQFWGEFLSDVKKYQIDSFSPGWSNSSDGIMLTKQRDNEILQSRIPAYQKLAQLKSGPFVGGSIKSGCLSFQSSIPHHGVLLIELKFHTS